MDNVLTVDEMARGEERAGGPHPHPGSLLEGVGGGGVRNSTVANFVETAVI